MEKGWCNRKENREILLLIRKIQDGDDELRNRFIAEWHDFILETVSRKINEKKENVLGMDAYSVGLMAFDEAVRRFHFKEDISFISFAALVIRRRIIDYERKLKRESEYECLCGIRGYYEKADGYHRNDVEIAEEMIFFKIKLDVFGIDFYELAQKVPIHKDTKETAIRISNIICGNEELRKYLFKKKRLPVKAIKKKTGISEKVLEKNRVFIIALVIIQTEELDYLKAIVGC